MLATSRLYDQYAPTANFVNVDAWVPPEWYLSKTKESGFDWVNVGGRGRLWSPGLVFLTDKGEYMCTMTGVFNNYTHAENIINGIKAQGRDYKKSSHQKECEGARV